MKGCGNALTKDQVIKAMAALDGTYGTRNKAMFACGLMVGLRVTEMLSIKVGDVYQHGSIVDRVYIQRKNRKGQREGFNPILNEEAKAYIKAWLEEQGDLSPDTYLFKSRKGENKPIDRKQALHVLKLAFDAAGIQGKTGTHSMRKTFARNVYEATGHNLKVVQELLGHSDILTTQAYLGVTSPEVYAAYNSLKIAG